MEKKKEYSSGTGWLLHFAMQISVMELGEETGAVIRRVKEAKQHKHRPFREKDVAEKGSFWAQAGVPRMVPIHLRPMYVNVVVVSTQRSLGASSPI